MIHTNRPGRTHDSGSILLVALVILVALSFIGGLALTTTNFELRLSRNDKIITRLKTRATAVALATAQKVQSLSKETLDDTDWDSESRDNKWLSRGLNDKFDRYTGGAFDLSNVDENGDPLVDDEGNPLNKKSYILSYTQNRDNWIEENSADFSVEEDDLADEETKKVYQESFLGCKFQAIDVGTTTRSSLRTGNNTTSMHEYYVSAYCNDGPQTRLVQLGYRKKH